MKRRQKTRGSSLTSRSLKLSKLTCQKCKPYEHHSDNQKVKRQTKKGGRCQNAWTDEYILAWSTVFKYTYHLLTVPWLYIMHIRNKVRKRANYMDAEMTLARFNLLLLVPSYSFIHSAMKLLTLKGIMANCRLPCSIPARCVVYLLTKETRNWHTSTDLKFSLSGAVFIHNLHSSLFINTNGKIKPSDNWVMTMMQTVLRYIDS